MVPPALETEYCIAKGYTLEYRGIHYHPAARDSAEDSINGVSIHGSLEAEGS